MKTHREERTRATEFNHKCLPESMTILDSLSEGIPLSWDKEDLIVFLLNRRQAHEASTRGIVVETFGQIQGLHPWAQHQRKPSGCTQKSAPDEV